MENWKWRQFILWTNSWSHGEKYKIICIVRKYVETYNGDSRWYDFNVNRKNAGRIKLCGFDRSRGARFTSQWSPIARIMPRSNTLFNDANQIHRPGSLILLTRKGLFPTKSRDASMHMVMYQRNIGNHRYQDWNFNHMIIHGIYNIQSRYTPCKLFHIIDRIITLYKL